MIAQKLSRREREKLRQRQDILTAALMLFSQKGYHNVSMQEIAEKAEFATGTLYKFFSAKKELYKTLILEQFDEFEKAFAGALVSGGSEIEKLRNYVRTKGEHFRNSLPFIRIYMAEARGVSFAIKSGVDETMRKRYTRLLEKLAAVFESGIKSKRFRNIASPFTMAVALDSTVNSMLLLWLESPEKYPYPENPDKILNIFFMGLMPS